MIFTHPGHYLYRCIAALYLCLSLGAAAEPLGLPPLPVPADNPVTPEKVALGDKLFHDTRFSSTGEIACKNCHLDGITFHDGRPVPRGVRKAHGTRNAPTVVNAAYFKNQFWDGRAKSLEEQALMPLFNPVEHGLQHPSQVLTTVRGDATYRAMFRTAFDVGPESITLKQFGKAIAAYERTLISGNSAFDRWYFGGDKKALSAAAIRGYQVFVGQGHCAACHHIGERDAVFTDDRFHNVNASFALLGPEAEQIAADYLHSKDGDTDARVLSDRQLSELGRFAISHRREDLGAFKTPTLRNIARTAPYLHDGSLNTLEKVVTYFNNGGKLRPDDPGPNPFQSPLIRPLNLSEQQQQDLVEFLESLTSPEYALEQ